MGERAKIILNEYSAKSLLMRDTLDLDKFYAADLKLFVEVARKEIVRLNDIINELEKYKYAYESIIKSLKGNINFLKRNELSEERIMEDTRVIRDLKFYYKNAEGDKE